MRQTFDFEGRKVSFTMPKTPLDALLFRRRLYLIFMRLYTNPNASRLLIERVNDKVDLIDRMLFDHEVLVSLNEALRIWLK